MIIHQRPVSNHKLVLRELCQRKSHTRTFTAASQYQVEGANGNSKIGGVPLVWTLPGDAVEERANWDCPLFSVRQGPGDTAHPACACPYHGENDCHGLSARGAMPQAAGSPLTHRS